MQNRALVMIFLTAICLTAACKKPPVVTPQPPAPAEVPAAPKPTPPPEPPVKEVPPETFRQPTVETREESVEEINQSGVLQTIHFDYDQSEIREEDRVILQGNAAWLKSNPKWKVRIEAHCDERGTLKYNLALGERRADATRSYLASLGIDSSRMRIVSFGEERPADAGHNEEAWARNRRAEFFVEP